MTVVAHSRTRLHAQSGVDTCTGCTSSGGACDVLSVRLYVAAEFDAHAGANLLIGM